MIDELISLLETFNVPVYRQGSLDKDYPDTFITFWNNEEVEHSAYDNETTSATDDYDINVYSKDPATTYSLINSIRVLLKAAGWTIVSRGTDVTSDEITHIGRGMRVIYLMEV